MKNYQQANQEPTASEKLANLHEFASQHQREQQQQQQQHQQQQQQQNGLSQVRPTLPFNLSAASLLLNPLYSQMASQNATSQVKLIIDS